MSTLIHRSLSSARSLILAVTTVVAVCLTTAALAINSVPESTSAAVGTVTPSNLAVPTQQGQGAVAAYTLEQRQIFKPAAGGQPFLRAKKERHQRSDGVFLIVHTYYRPDGSIIAVETGLGYLGLGAYRIDEKNNLLEFIAAQDVETPTATEEQLRADPGFEQEETVAGQRTLVARYSNKGTATSYRQAYRAPGLQNLEIKTVTVSPRGEEVIEPVRIDLGEPAPTLFANVLHYRKSYTRYEELIRQAEQKGEVERAMIMRRHLARVRGWPPPLKI